MGFRSSPMPIFRRAAVQVLLDDTRNYAAGATADFTLQPDLFDSYTPLLIEVISDPTFAWFHCRAAMYLPGSTSRSINKTLMASDGWALFPVQPIGGQVVIRMTNADSFGGDMTVRVLRARGIEDVRELVKASAVMTGGRQTSIPAGVTTGFSILGSASTTHRARCAMHFTQIHDIRLRWREWTVEAGGQLLEFDEVIATAVPANTETSIDRPYQGSGAVQIRVTNTSGAVGTLTSSHYGVPLGF